MGLLEFIAKEPDEKIVAVNSRNSGCEFKK